MARFLSLARFKGDLVGIVGSESLEQARRIVGRKGIAWKKPADPEIALKYAQENHSGMPASLVDDVSGYYGQIYSIPVLKEKPTETLK